MAQQAAFTNVRATVPSIEAFYADHNTYAGATIPELRRNYDSGISPKVKLAWVGNKSYCVESTVDGQTASFAGPGGTVLIGRC